MKTFLSIALAIILLASVQSCSDNGLAGSWLGAPTRINIGGTADTQVTPKLTFVPNEENDTEGDVTIASEIAVLDVLPSNDSLVAPYEISLYGTSEIKGTYRMVDDDEIIISLDSSTLNVNISSKDIRFNESQFTQRLIPDEIQDQAPQIARRYASRIQHTLGIEILQYSRLDDVKIDKDLLMCEINDRDVTFRSLTPRK